MPCTKSHRLALAHAQDYWPRHTAGSCTSTKSTCSTMASSIFCSPSCQTVSTLLSARASVSATRESTECHTMSLHVTLCHATMRRRAQISGNSSRMVPLDPPSCLIFLMKVSSPPHCDLQSRGGSSEGAPARSHRRHTVGRRAQHV